MPPIVCGMEFNLISVKENLESRVKTQGGNIGFRIF